MARTRRRRTNAAPLLPFSPIRNSEFLSNHWLDHRLQLEPEWTELRSEAESVLGTLIQLWGTQENRVERYGDEAGLEEAFIQPVFEALGWTLKYQTFLQGREPDYGLFKDGTVLDAALAVDRTSPDFWRYPTLVADAKAWHVSLDRPSRVRGRREYPPEQIEWYLIRSQCDYGILTNGKLWRLVPRELGPGNPRFQTYLEVDLPRLLRACIDNPQLFQAVEFEDFLKFYLFFSPRGFHPAENRDPLIRRAIAGSSEYRLGVSEDLKERVFDALRLAIEGFLTFEPNQLSPHDHLEICRQQSLILLYRLLFIMYAEDRSLLPYRVNQTYTNNRSLARHRDDIATRLDRIADGREDDYSKVTISIWDDLNDLFDLINRGHGRYGVPAYNGGLFNPESHSFLSEKAIPDWYLSQIIDQLGCAPDRDHDDELFRVDYRDLAIQHLGSVYEGLLELRPRYATQPMVVVTKQTRDKRTDLIQADGDPIPSGFRLTDTRYEADSVFLQTDKGERRSFGSYYTPDHIVDFIVNSTLGPLCREVSEALATEIDETENTHRTARGANRAALASKLEALRSDFDDRILRLRILDPAMGSGHFLVRACQYLAEEIATDPNTGDPAADALSGDESVLAFWKRRVVESCIYGVDLNLMAVELAKLALWLETVAVDQPLSFLDHHLAWGNSLIGGRIEELGWLPDAPEIMRNNFRVKMDRQLPTLLEPLFEIQRLPSDTADQVKTKDRLYNRQFRPTHDAFKMVADLWCSTFFADQETRVTPDHYEDALDALGDPRAIRQLLQADWVAPAIRPVRAPDVRAFHWELDFPMVFFGPEGRRPDAGFDAVIGNPPYDVLAERELGRDLTSFKAFVEFEPAYAPSRRGKNNLYKIFICRALSLLRDGGRLSFIVPMALLGDDQAAEIRRTIIQQGAFNVVHAFPQKDDSKKRVFRDAKLSTTVFAMIKSQDERRRQESFPSQVHPAQFIEEDSPRLQLSSPTVPLYDPSNSTIVSCSQADWDLAVEITQNGRLSRLGEFTEFFQGEVNETNERRRGNLIDQANRGRLVTRGACICLYVPRQASQGTDLHLNVQRFLRGKGHDTKAFHHRHPRIALQESSPQNNFRRIIASLLPAGEFCNHTINYAPEPKSSIDLRLVLALLNSKLADWYFRLGSTNAHVSHYQLYNLPCPVFRQQETPEDQHRRARALDALQNNNFDDTIAALADGMVASPFSQAVRDVILLCVDRIIAIENRRGNIQRAERSSLAATAQPYQDAIDRLLYQMAGLSEAEAAALEARLVEML